MSKNPEQGETKQPIDTHVIEKILENANHIAPRVELATKSLEVADLAYGNLFAPKAIEVADLAGLSLKRHLAETNAVLKKFFGKQVKLESPRAYTFKAGRYHMSVYSSLLPLVITGTANQLTVFDTLNVENSDSLERLELCLMVLPGEGSPWDHQLVPVNEIVAPKRSPEPASELYEAE